ncbi:MAG: rhodanese-like domain-containing protein [Verrucomicrobia bacterium]|nr:rhodanese-like domain-containing protein [Verrucomicrobiota bacterium]
MKTILTWKNPAVLWVDARSAKEFEQGHIPGAMRLNEDAWEELLAPFLEAWSAPRPVVVYCGDQPCEASRHVAGRLRDAGIKPVYVLKGGWDAWQKTHPSSR